MKVRWLILHVWRGDAPEFAEPASRFKLVIPGDAIQVGDRVRVAGITEEEEGPWVFDSPVPPPPLSGLKGDDAATSSARPARRAVRSRRRG